MVAYLGIVTKPAGRSPAVSGHAPFPRSALRAVRRPSNFVPTMATKGTPMRHAPLPDPYPDTETSRTRRKVAIAVAVTAAVTAVVVAAGIVYLAGSSKDAGGPAAAGSPSAIVVDASAQKMCGKLLDARLLDAKGDHKPAPGGYGGSVNDIKALTARTQAQTYAINSTVPELKQIGLDAADDTTRQLESWCKAHDLG